ncbi:MAG: alanine--tRNA ligase, partial [Candidatus Omnitrophota bacterium]|nr:alanine--tRNA ligase [Candidatus Omnitrophota bacterium]
EGYVERMLIRRAFRFGKELGIQIPFLYKLVPPVTKVMKNQYPELETMRENIADLVLSEERRFENTLEEGSRVLEEIVAGLKIKEKNVISGKDAFMLYDTYGFPIELTSEIARSRDISVDRNGYEEAMKKQRERARSKSKIKSSIFEKQEGENVLKKLSQSLNPTAFFGYKAFETEAKVLVIVKSGERVKRAEKGDEVEIVMDNSPFYGEAGGQAGDSGEISSGASKIRISGTKRIGNIIVHHGEVLKGEIKENDKVKASVDKGLRLDIARNHTATHLLHYALREILGRHVKQSGSLAAGDRLRFDFTHFKNVDKRELDRIEELINELIRENVKVGTGQLELAQAKKIGVIALFGEKYGKKVRMVSIGNYSKELCGGTHVDYTGQIGLFRIVSENSIASGIRRIEAITGRTAYRSLKKDEEALSDAVSALKTFKKDTEKRISNLKSERAGVDIEKIISGSKEISGVRVVSTRLKNINISGLRNTADSIKKKIGSSIVVLGSDIEGKVAIVCSVSSDLVSKGASANKVIKKISRAVGGSGGGRADFAQAGGKNAAGLDKALNKVMDIVREEFVKKGLTR